MKKLSILLMIQIYGELELTVGTGAFRLLTQVLDYVILLFILQVLLL